MCTRRPLPPRLTCPPLRPAALASSEVHWCAVPLRCAARPPLLAISRCLSDVIEANPRVLLRKSLTILPPCLRVGIPLPSPSDSRGGCHRFFKRCATTAQ